MSHRSIVVSGIRHVLDAVGASLPAENVRDALEFLEYDEWGEALSLICTQLYEFRVPFGATHQVATPTGRYLPHALAVIAFSRCGHFKIRSKDGWTPMAI
jgi:hypothetical protein